MRVNLMFAERDFDPEPPVPTRADVLTADLGLATILDAMAQGDRFLLDICRAALFQSLTSESEVRYRQQIVQDALTHEKAVRTLYALACEGIEADQHIHVGITRNPGTMLRRSRECLVAFAKVLRELRDAVEEHRASFTSPGLSRLCDMLASQLSWDYLDSVDQCLRILEFRHGSLSSARLGETNRGSDYVLRTPGRTRWGGVELLLSHSSARFTVTVADRDIAGMNALTELANHGLASAADALVRSTDHVLGFFKTLRCELAFYLGCANLHHQLERVGQPICIPGVIAADRPTLTAHGLVDPLLAISSNMAPVGNDVVADGARLLVITGANQGGKSTLLRALGIAQIMMQSGMFVAANDYRASLVSGVHTHFKREEDDTMASGKLDEELDRMSRLIDDLASGGLVLCNESFATTNEREAAEVGGDVIEGLLAAGTKVYLVTHQFPLARRLAAQVPDAVFLRAERRDDGTRPFQVTPGEPLRTSYGSDLYAQVFGICAESRESSDPH